MKKQIILKLFFFGFLFSFFFHSQVSFCQDSVNSNSFLSTGLRAHYAYLWLHTKDMKPIGNSFPWGLQMEFNWHLAGEKVWNQCNCYPRTGFFISYFDFSNPQVLGSSWSAVYYLEPWFTVRHKINFSLRGAAGLSYLNRPYHEVSNPYNIAYSMFLGGFLAIHLGANYRLNDYWNLSATANINHISNGGIKEPNKGINLPSATFSADYSIKPQKFPVRKRTTFQKDTLRKYKMETTIHWAGKIILHGEKKRYFVYGSGMKAVRKVGKMNALCVGAEWHWDFALKEKLRREGVENADNHRAGILFGHEFLMGRFSFSQMLGAYVYDPHRYNDAVYQRYGISYLIRDKFLVGMNLKAHRHVADFMDFRTGMMW